MPTAEAELPIVPHARQPHACPFKFVQLCVKCLQICVNLSLLFYAQFDDVSHFESSASSRGASKHLRTCHNVQKSNERFCTVEGTSNSVSMNALCFGDFSYGQVVASDTNLYGVPDRPSFYAFKQTERCFTLQWKQISAGGYHSCGITLTDVNGKNQLICWGLEDDGQLNVMYPGAPASLSTGSTHSNLTC